MEDNVTSPDPQQGSDGEFAEPHPATTSPPTNVVLRVIAIVRKTIDRILAVLCIVAFTLLVVIVAWQVFTREVLNKAAPWTEEAARYTFVILAILAAAYVFSERGHIAVEIVISKLPHKAQRIAGVCLELIVIFFVYAAFIVGGLRVADKSWNQDLSTLPFTVGQIYLILPIAGIIIIFYSIAHIIGVIAGTTAPLAEIDENAEAI